MLLLASDVFIVFGNTHRIDFGLSPSLTSIFLTIFLISTLYFFKNNFDAKDTFQVVDLLWKIFITGAFCLFIVKILIGGIVWSLQGTRLMNEQVAVDLIYQLSFTLAVVFFIPVIYIFKKMILYQRSRRIVYLWNIFHLLLLVTLVFNFYTYKFNDPLILGFLALCVLIILILSINLKWIAFLNYVQKWKSIFLLFFILATAAVFVYHFFNEGRNQNLIINIRENIFFQVVAVFLFIYGVLSLLVLLFNLPTSSVFEQKFEDVKGFQKLSEIGSLGHNENEIFTTLIEAGIKGSLSQAGWLEQNSDDGKIKIVQHKGILPEKILQLKEVLKDVKPDAITGNIHVKRLRDAEKPFKINSGFRSLLGIPLQAHKEKLGFLFLLKDISNGFEKEIIDLMTTFVIQATVSIENSRLIKKSIEFGLYEEELKIARNVQKGLLPKDFSSNKHIELTTRYYSADEVGGDYYDFFNHPDGQITLVIGDVSGKGTSAAFHTAQLKGIFQGLVRLNLSPFNLLSLANNAVHACLEKSTFLTLSLYKIDPTNRTYYFVRGGHSPALYYENATHKITEQNPKGIGLGIVGESEFKSMTEECHQHYSPGDILLIFTDGIIESKNESGELYGIQRLRELFNVHHSQGASALVDIIMEDIKQFSGKAGAKDDYTLLAVRFVS
ncbi:MAG: hypothetical protein A3H98_09695 [Bacteroidetes bacterium RIFCSPLOWO2_02_FULL_36_8]|nr:MAG: hypothetical protein A3H98_09695 [Bacteroidetes bacterium RIFCSPLOWO2_02_FULL_36_8]OFY68761.1 MAG: hypothetical protein A3G23_02920 [Bacteroidetes bacterium RIFCSPLOWO2_12_FULL_37_12]